MVLESLTNPYKAEMHPGWVALHGALYALVAFGLSVWLWPAHASMVMVFLITAASIPLLYNIVKYEEEKDFHELDEKILIKEHGRAVSAYMMLFIGVTLALAFLYVVIPESMLDLGFGAQIQTYQGINPTSQVVGKVTDVTGNATASAHFMRIFMNNLKVLLFCIVFSFLYGAGAIFIITWNASVIAMAIGNQIRIGVGSLAGIAGWQKVGAYLSVGAHTIFLRYGIHGLMEIAAYVIAGLAGGIISVAVARHHFSERKFEHIVLDSADLFLISIVLVFLAGIVETFVTPAFI